MDPVPTFPKKSEDEQRELESSLNEDLIFPETIEAPIRIGAKKLSKNQRQKQQDKEAYEGAYGVKASPLGKPPRRFKRSPGSSEPGSPERSVVSKASLVATSASPRSGKQNKPKVKAFIATNTAQGNRKHGSKSLFGPPPDVKELKARTAKILQSLEAATKSEEKNEDDAVGDDDKSVAEEELKQALREAEETLSRTQSAKPKRPDSPSSLGSHRSRGRLVRSAPNESTSSLGQSSVGGSPTKAGSPVKAAGSPMRGSPQKGTGEEEPPKPKPRPRPTKEQQERINARKEKQKNEQNLRELDDIMINMRLRLHNEVAEAIQRCWQRYYARKIRREELAVRNKATAKIQAGHRQRVARAHAYRKREAILTIQCKQRQVMAHNFKETRKAAVPIMQSAVRRKLVYNENERQREGATRFQNRWRTNRAQKKVAEARTERDRKFEGAVLLLQARYRQKHHKKKFQTTISSLAESAQLAQVGNYKAAELKLREAVDQSNNNHAIFLQLGSVQEVRGDHEGAIETYRKAIAENPDHSASRMRLGMALQKVGKFEEAIEVMRHLKERRPKTRERSKTPKSPGDGEESGLGPTEPDEPPPDAEEHDPALHMNLGVMYRKNGQLQEALEEFQSAVKIAPNDPVCHSYVGIVCLEMRDRTAALTAFERVVELDPTHVTALTQIGALKTKMQDYDGAIDAYQTALEKQPDLMKVQFALGEVLAKAQRREEAIDVLKLITEKDAPQANQKKEYQVYRSAYAKLSQLMSSHPDPEIRAEGEEIRKKVEAMTQGEKAKKEAAGPASSAPEGRGMVRSRNARKREASKDRPSSGELA